MSNDKPNRGAHFVRVPKEIYDEIKVVAEQNGRTIQMQTQILLGAALNRGLVNPGKVISENNSDEL